MERWTIQIHLWCGIVNNNNQKVYSINGMPDHVNVLLSVKPSCSVSDLIGDIKAGASKWLNTKKYVKGEFQW